MIAPEERRWRARRRGHIRGEVNALVTILWRAKRPGDLRDIAHALRLLRYPTEHEFTLRPEVRAALRYLQRHGRAVYVRGRGWCPGPA